MKLVTIDDPPRMNLLGLMLAHIIERNLIDQKRKRAFDRLKGEVVIQAGEMIVTLQFNHGQLVIRRGTADKPRAAIGGTLDTLLNLSLGGSMIRPVLSGQLRPRGNLLLLLRLKDLLHLS